jgi:hypothetical protein
MLSSYLTGYCIEMASTSNSPGRRARMPTTISSMSCSRLLPPVAVERGCTHSATPHSVKLPA